MFRQALLILGLLAILLGLFLSAIGLALPLGIYLCLTGVIVTGALLIERRGYRPSVNRAGGKWQETNERFIDPVSGHLIVVRYNPETGERDYVDKGMAE